MIVWRRSGRDQGPRKFTHVERLRTVPEFQLPEPSRSNVNLSFPSISSDFKKVPESATNGELDTRKRQMYQLSFDLADALKGFTKTLCSMLG